MLLWYSSTAIYTWLYLNSCVFDKNTVHQMCKLNFSVIWFFLGLCLPLATTYQWMHKRKTTIDWKWSNLEMSEYLLYSGLVLLYVITPNHISQRMASFWIHFNKIILKKKIEISITLKSQFIIYALVSIAFAYIVKECLLS